MVILVTTSRHPNPRLRSFVNDLARALPNAISINRGKLNIEELAVEAYRREANTVIIVGRGQRGNPGRIIFMHIYEDHYEFYPLIIHILGVKLLREIPEAKPIRVEKEIICYSSDDEATEKFALSLSEAIGLPILKIGHIDDFMGLNAIMFVETALKPKISFVLKFILPKKKELLIIGPLIRIKRVIYKCPATT